MFLTFIQLSSVLCSCFMQTVFHTFFVVGCKVERRPDFIGLHLLYNSNSKKLLLIYAELSCTGLLCRFVTKFIYLLTKELYNILQLVLFWNHKKTNLCCSGVVHKFILLPLIRVPISMGVESYSYVIVSYLQV